MISKSLPHMEANRAYLQDVGKPLGWLTLSSLSLCSILIKLVPDCGSEEWKMEKVRPRHR